MKRLCLLLILLSVSSSLFALSDRYVKIIKAASTAEEKGNYVYALNYYYEAMEEEPFLGEDAFEGFESLAEKVRSGNLSDEGMDPFDVNDLWCNIIKAYNQYYTKNNPYVYNFGELVCTSLDFTNKTSNWEVSYKASFSPKYLEVYDILKEGFSNVNHSGWNNIDPHWLENSAIREELDFTVDIIDDAGKIIASAQTEDNTAVFTNINRENTKALNRQAVKLNVTNNKGKSVVVQTPYKKYRRRVDVLALHKAMEQDYIEDEYSIDDMVFPFNVLNKAVEQDYFDYVMDDYYNWLSKQAVKGNRDDVSFKLTYGTAFVFCNLLSEKYKLKPCYSCNGTTNVYEWGLPGDIKNIVCNYELTGFRLPDRNELSLIPSNGKFVYWDNEKNNYGYNLSVSNIIVVRSDVQKRSELSKKIKYDKDNALKEQMEIEAEKAREEEEKAELERIAADEALAQQLALEEQKEQEKLAKQEKREEALRKLKETADSSNRSAILLRGSYEYTYSKSNGNMDLYGSFGYHFLFAFGEVEFPSVQNFAKADFPFDQIKIDSFNYILGAGIDIPVSDKVKAYVSAGMNFFEKTEERRFVQYSLGMDFVPFYYGLAMNLELGAKYNIKLNEYVPRAVLGIGVEF